MKVEGPTSYEVAVDDLVQVSDRNGRGWTECRVVKIGRTLIHIRVGGRVVAFRLADQLSANDTHGIGFRTQAQAAMADARAVALADLKRHGVDARWSRLTTPNLIALAAIVDQLEPSR